MDLGLAGRGCVVTGASRGIGLQVAKRLCAEGASVVLVARGADELERAAGECESRGGRAMPLPLDVTEPDAAERILKAAAELGDLDVLVNNAGIYPFALTHETSTDDFDSTFAINVRAPFFLTAAIAPRMAARGSGSIVNVATMAAHFGLPGASAYGASKAAVVSLTKTWAAEYGPHGVRVNAVSAGTTRTEGTAGMGDDLDQLAQTSPLGRPASPEEIAEAIVFLASPRSSYVNGAILPADGGRIAV
jgi:NAD(P)-dependent dehydrogenase (short-subunit alcohol dehydrogenase family)